MYSMYFFLLAIFVSVIGFSHWSGNLISISGFIVLFITIFSCLAS
ncbi:MAG: hypothetical protein V1672_03920 [Candidatus Diapherotrites archaeon]